MAQNETGEDQALITEVQGLEAEDITLPGELASLDAATAKPEQVEALIKVAKSAIAQKQRWRGIAVDPTTKKPYKVLIPAKSNGTNGNAPAPQEALEELTGTVKTLAQAEEKRQFGSANKISAEATDAVFAFAAGQGKKPAEVMDQPAVKAMLAGLAQAERVSGGTPPPSGRSPVVEGKTFAQMDDKEKEKNFSSVVGALGRKG